MRTPMSFYASVVNAVNAFIDYNVEDGLQPGR